MRIGATEPEGIDAGKGSDIAAQRYGFPADLQIEIVERDVRIEFVTME